MALIILRQIANSDRNVSQKIPQKIVTDKAIASSRTRFIPVNAIVNVQPHCNGHFCWQCEFASHAAEVQCYWDDIRSRFLVRELSYFLYDVIYGWPLKIYGFVIFSCVSRYLRISLLCVALGFTIYFITNNSHDISLSENLYSDYIYVNYINIIK